MKNLFHKLYRFVFFRPEPPAVNLLAMNMIWLDESTWIDRMIANGKIERLLVR